MKLILSLFVLFTFNAFALDICSFEDTMALQDAVQAGKLRQIKSSKQHHQFTALEQGMIHAMITATFEAMPMSQALEEFADMYDGKIGTNAGEIEYYADGTSHLVMVRYWPGDTEVGAFFSVARDGSFKLLATIDDQWISCNK